MGKGPVLYVRDIILGEVEVREVGEAVHGCVGDHFELVLIEPQVVDGVIDVLGDGLIWRLVLTADG